ncbi:MAG TPA: energy transducer TonB [Rhodanobacteraceae bacterium]
MTSLVLRPQHECAPHVIRTLAMACAIALNLTALLIALRPLPLVPMALPVAQPEMRANVLEPTHPPPPPPMPILNPVRHVVHTAPVPTVTKPVATAPNISVPTQVVTTERSTVATPVVQPVTPPSTMGSTDATIAYETATPPPYPVAELRAGVQGTVLLRVLVDESGKPVQVAIVKSSGSHALDQAARNHVLAAWRFHPAQRDGHAIQAWAQVPVEFELSGA